MPQPAGSHQDLGQGMVFEQADREEISICAAASCPNVCHRSDKDRWKLYEAGRPSCLFPRGIGVL